jgi:hypothetical protein
MKVLIHAGTYGESVVISNCGMPGKPIVFKALGDDEVIMDGADTFPADKWQAVPDSKSIYATGLECDPGQVVVDGLAFGGAGGTVAFPLDSPPPQAGETRPLLRCDI